MKLLWYHRTYGTVKLSAPFALTCSGQFGVFIDGYCEKVLEYFQVNEPAVVLRQISEYCICPLSPLFLSCLYYYSHFLSLFYPHFRYRIFRRNI